MHTEFGSFYCILDRAHSSLLKENLYLETKMFEMTYESVMLPWALVLANANVPKLEQMLPDRFQQPVDRFHSEAWTLLRHRANMSIMS